MSLPFGTALGPYEIVALLGAGGMGEVYRARDTRLQRDVALKVIAKDAIADAERLVRFEQEARATAALNHPNIVAVFDIGQSDSGPFIVSELLEGETLRERLARGRLSARTALEIGAQIARGLAAAHDKGIVHRDLKPDNIFVTKDGMAKILDFGLAKLRETPHIGLAETVAGGVQSPARTGPGVVLGTVGYMAPEQVRGEPADHRSDIFALGCVLYELLAGQRAFGGASHVETMHAILTVDPAELGTEGSAPISNSVDRLVRRCLEKDQAQRFQSSRDLAFALEAIGDSRASSSGAVAATPIGVKPLGRAVPWAVAFVLAVALAWSLRPVTALPAPPRMEFRVAMPATRSGNQFALSPSGSHLVTTVTHENSISLWVEPLTGEPGSLIRTDDASFPFFSADGGWIGFFSGSALRRVNLEGGLVQTVATVTNGTGGTSNHDGTIVFADQFGPLFRVSAAGGPITPLTALNSTRAELAHLHPQFLPDGRHFIYLALSRQSEHTGVYVASLDSPQGTFLTPTSVRALVARPGFLLFLRGDTLMAQRFDLDALSLSGEPVRFAENVGNFLANGAAGIAVAGDGMLAIRRLLTSGQSRTLQWVDRTGRSSVAVPEHAEYTDLALSPDGRQLAVGKMARPANAAGLWIVDLQRGSQMRFTTDPAHHVLGAWSRDGLIAYSKGLLGGARGVFVKNASGVAPERSVATVEVNSQPVSWSPDGKSLLYWSRTRQSASVWLLTIGSAQKAVPLTNAREFQEFNGRLSPDGRWLAYDSDESGRQEVYVVEYPDAKSRTAISTSGGGDPRWRQDGREVIFRQGSQIMGVEVSVSSTGALQASSPRQLFEVAGLNDWDVTGDGQRFIVSVNEKAQGAPAEEPIRVIQNWQSIPR